MSTGLPPFCFPVRELSNDRVKLIPFNATLHAETFFKLSEPQQEDIWAHMSYGPFANTAEFVKIWLDQVSNPDPGTFVFAVIDKTQPATSYDKEGALAGMFCYQSGSAPNLRIEIGGVVTLPPFQRTHVTSNALGLLLNYALDPASSNGLGLRRVLWMTSSANTASQRIATKFGFRYEGCLRWERVFKGGKAKGKSGNGRTDPPGTEEGDLGRDTMMYSICWDDWIEGTREHVQRLMDRK